MERCPELFELEAFFEVPATFAYGNENGWYYDQVCFSQHSHGESVVCQIEPVENTLSIFHTVNGATHLDISLQYVRSLDLEKSAGTELLIGHVHEGGIDQLFKISLKPSFSFHLSTALPSFE
jgi:hypothetical protein